MRPTCMKSRLTLVNTGKSMVIEGLCSDTINHIEGFAKEELSLCDECDGFRLLSMSDIKVCDYCKKTQLCKSHSNQGYYFANHYRRENRVMCNKCCWFEAT